MRTTFEPAFVITALLFYVTQVESPPVDPGSGQGEQMQDTQPMELINHYGCSLTYCIVGCQSRPGITVTWEHPFSMGSEVMYGLHEFCKSAQQYTEQKSESPKDMPTCAAMMSLPSSVGGTPFQVTWEVRNTKSDKAVHMKLHDMSGLATLCRPRNDLPTGPARRIIRENQVFTVQDGGIANATYRDFEIVHMHLLQDLIINSQLPSDLNNLQGRLDHELSYARGQLQNQHLSHGVLALRNPALRDLLSVSSTAAKIYYQIRSPEDMNAEQMLSDYFRGATTAEMNKVHDFITDSSTVYPVNPTSPPLVVEGRSIKEMLLKPGPQNTDPTVGTLDKHYNTSSTGLNSTLLVTFSGNDFAGRVYYAQDGCYSTNEDHEWKELKSTMSILSRCTKETMNVCLRCAPLTVPQILDSSNDICFIDSERVRVVGLYREAAQDFDMCHFYCRIKKNGTEEWNTPLYRSTVFRSPFLNMKGDFKSTLEDRLYDRVGRSGAKSRLAECWDESLEDYMSDDQRLVQHLAMTDKYSHCDKVFGRGARDTVYIPSSCMEQTAVTLPTSHMQAFQERSVELTTCTIPVQLCYSPHCTVSFTSTSTTVSVNMKAKYAKYQISDGNGGVKRGYFTGSKLETVEFDGPGAKFVQGVCNQKNFERNIMFTEREYCDEMHPGYSNMLNNVYCKRPKTVKICATVLLASTAAYLSRHLLRGALGIVVSAVLFLPTTYLLDKYLCKKCCCYKLFRSHKCCNYRCKYCGKIFMTATNLYVEDRELEKRRNDHYKICKKECGQGTTLECAVSKTYQLGLALADVLFKVIPGAASTTAAIVLIILVWSKAEASSVANDHQKVMGQLTKDLSPYIEDLKSTGYHPYFARNFDGNREDIVSIHEENDCGSKVCHLKMKIETELIVTKGREFGFTVWPKKKYGMDNFTGLHVNIRFTDPQRTCTYKEIYGAGKPTHGFRSRDTCTEGCDVCVSKLKSERFITDAAGNTNITYSTHENTASWACDGPGCAAINQGCTCGACFCLIEHKTHSVRKLVKETQTVNLCLQVGGEGFCKRIGPEERTKHMTVVKSGEPPRLCPELIACEIGSHHCYEGAIADIGDFSNKFGNPKLLSDNFTAYSPDVHYTEQCLFAKHRWFQYSKCCIDTYGMVDNLKHVNFINPQGKEDHADEVQLLPTEDAGTWKFTLKLPPFIYNKEKDVLQLSDLKIDHCSGCHSCDEGGSCLLSYRSNYDSTPQFSCKGVRVDVNTIRLKKGSGFIPFNVFANKESGNMTCTIGPGVASGEYRLTARPKHPHGDGVIKIAGSKVVQGECGSMFCGTNYGWDFSWNPFGSLKEIGLFILAVAIIIAVAYYSLKFAYHQFCRYRRALAMVR